MLVETCNCFLQVADVKKNIETVQGSDVYPAAQQMLIHQGKVLKDGTTLAENNVAENSFVVIMLTKVVLIFFCAFIELLLPFVSSQWRRQGGGRGPPPPPFL